MLLGTEPNKIYKLEDTERIYNEKRDEPPLLLSVGSIPQGKTLEDNCSNRCKDEEWKKKTDRCKRYRGTKIHVVILAIFSSFTNGTMLLVRYLGIDYGAKRVGIAISDEMGSIAFPKITLSNARGLFDKLVTLIRNEDVGVVVMGESKNKDGKDNPIMEHARALARALESTLSLPVYFEPEYYSSLEARRHAETNIVDAQAAAIILNRYLERLKNNLSR